MYVHAESGDFRRLIQMLYLMNVFARAGIYFLKDDHLRLK